MKHDEHIFSGEISKQQDRTFSVTMKTDTNKIEKAQENELQNSQIQSKKNEDDVYQSKNIQCEEVTYNDIVSEETKLESVQNEEKFYKETQDNENQSKENENKKLQTMTKDLKEISTDVSSDEAYSCDEENEQIRAPVKLLNNMDDSWEPQLLNFTVGDHDENYLSNIEDSEDESVKELAIYDNQFAMQKLQNFKKEDDSNESSDETESFKSCFEELQSRSPPTNVDYLENYTVAHAEYAIYENIPAGGGLLTPIYEETDDSCSIQSNRCSYDIASVEEDLIKFDDDAEVDEINTDDNLGLNQRNAQENLSIVTDDKKESVFLKNSQDKSDTDQGGYSSDEHQYKENYTNAKDQGEEKCSNAEYSIDLVHFIDETTLGSESVVECFNNSNFEEGSTSEKDKLKEEYIKGDEINNENNKVSMENEINKNVEYAEKIKQQNQMEEENGVIVVKKEDKIVEQGDRNENKKDMYKKNVSNIVEEINLICSEENSSNLKNQIDEQIREEKKNEKTSTADYKKLNKVMEKIQKHCDEILEPKKNLNEKDYENEENIDKVSSYGEHKFHVIQNTNYKSVYEDVKIENKEEIYDIEIPRFYRSSSVGDNDPGNIKDKNRSVEYYSENELIVNSLRNKNEKNYKKKARKENHASVSPKREIFLEKKYIEDIPLEESLSSKEENHEEGQIVDRYYNEENYLIKNHTKESTTPPNSPVIFLNIDGEIKTVTKKEVEVSLSVIQNLEEDFKTIQEIRSVVKLIRTKIENGENKSNYFIKLMQEMRRLNCIANLNFNLDLLNLQQDTLNEIQVCIDLLKR